jgi:hypothetical protein
MATGWEVDYQDPRTDFRGGGRAIDVVDVHYVITEGRAAGHRDYVTVEKQNYSPERVAALIDDAVSTAQAVAAL